MAKAVKQGELISLRSGRDTILVDIEKFGECSPLIKKLQEEDRLPDTIDLTKFDVSTVAAFCGFIGNADVDIATVHLTDLIDLARIFQMRSLLNEIHQLVNECSQSTERISFVIRVLPLLSEEDWLAGDDLQEQIMRTAARNFTRLTICPAFYTTPPDVFENLLQRCDLCVEAECEVAEAAIKWLCVRKDALLYAFRMLSTVRVANLSIPQRSRVHKLLKRNVYKDSTLRAIAQVVLNDANSLRVCAIANHVPPVYRRCGDCAIADEFVLMIPTTEVSPSSFAHSPSPPVPRTLPQTSPVVLAVPSSKRGPPSTKSVPPKAHFQSAVSEPRLPNQVFSNGSRSCGGVTKVDVQICAPHAHTASQGTPLSDQNGRSARHSTNRTQPSALASDLLNRNGVNRDFQNATQVRRLSFSGRTSSSSRSLGGNDISMTARPGSVPSSPQWSSVDNTQGSTVTPIPSPRSP